VESAFRRTLLAADLGADIKCRAEERRLEPIARLVRALRHEVTVSVERNLNGRVPELLGDVFRMLALGDEEARERMPQIVEADPLSTLGVHEPTIPSS
jgi:hypothetical protein